MKILKATFFLILSLGLLPTIVSGQTDCLESEILVVGDDPTILCQGDGQPDVIRFTTDDNSMPHAYAVVDEDGIILHIGTSNNIDFENLPVGDLRVYAFSWLGTIIAEVGNDFFNTHLASVCYQISNNFIPLINETPDGGSVSTDDGQESIVLCLGVGLPSEVTFVTDSDASQYMFVVTDEDNNILALSPTGVVDFADADFGVCRVWGVSYVGNFIAEIGANIQTANLASECYDVSGNYVEVLRLFPDAGTVAYSDGSVDFVSCSEQEPSMVLSLDVMNNDPNTEFTFVLVDAASGNIVQFIDGSDLDLATIPAGTFQIYGLSYTGNLVVGPGDAFFGGPLSDECDDRSDNFLSLVKRVQDAGAVSLADGSTDITICVGDGVADELSFISDYSGPDQFTYVVTDENNIVLAIPSGSTVDFEDAGAGICRVWGLVYSGNLSLSPDDDLSAAIASDECFDLSDNFVEVDRNGPIGGTLSFSTGETTIINCSDSTPSGSVEVVVQDNDGSLDYALLLVNADDNTLVEVLAGNIIDLATLPEGSYEIYGVSYFGTIQLTPGDIFDPAILVDGCFDISDNNLTLISEVITAGSLSFDDGETTAYICPDDGVPDLLTFMSDYSGNENFVYVITDESGFVFQISIAETLDFDNPGPEEVYIWGIAYTGDFLLQPGMTLDETTEISTECYALTSNSLLVDRNGPVGGNIVLDGGDTEISICVGDGIADELSFSTDGGGDNFIWLITNENNELLTTTESGTFDFEDAEGGVCLIYGVAYSGELLVQSGENIFGVPISELCNDISANAITVTRTFVDGGSVSLLGGGNSAFACGGDGVADFFEFEFTTTASENYQLVITNDLNEILAVLDGTAIDLDEAAPGNCRVWGLSYSGELIAEIGDLATDVQLSDGCFELSSNFVAIRREQVEGGTISFTGGGDIRNICPDDGTSDILSFETTGTSTDDYVYVLTDPNNEILGLVDGNSLDFDNILAPEAVRIYAVAYSGVLSAPAGQDIADVILSNECYDLSDNFLTIIREVPTAGTVATASGQTEISLCTDDGISDEMGFTASGASNTPFAYVITDDANNILSIVADGDSFDFEGAPDGVCRVWGVAYTGTLLAQMDDDITAVALSDDCYDLSDNFITVIRGELNAGTVALNNGNTTIYTCPGDGLADLVQADSVGVAEANYLYLLTDESNVVVEILEADVIDMDDQAEGTYRLWGLNYTGDLLVSVGDNAAEVMLASGCADLSDNFITVVNITPSAGTITTADGATEVEICIGDGIPDPVELSVTGASNANYTYLVVDEDGFLVGTLESNTFDFENAAPGDWTIYGFSYTGTFSALPGANIAEDPLASGCSELTSEGVLVIKTQVNGGMVFTEDNEQVIYTCPDDGIEDIYNFINSSIATDASYTYVLTTDDNFVLSILEDATVDFEATAGFDNLHLWGVSYTGDLSIGLGQVITEVALSDGCYSLSQNFVDIYRDQPDGGNLSVDGGDTFRLCHSNFMPGVQMDNGSSSLAGYVYFITDTANAVLAIDEAPDDLVDFTAQEPGIYRVWGLSYTGEVLVAIGDTIPMVAMPASSCFDWSPNFVTIERTESLDGGDISTSTNEDTIYVCQGDGIEDLVILFTTSTDLLYKYVITDTMNNIIVPDVEGNIINFDEASAGVCRIYGVSFTGELNPGFNDNILTDPLSDDCWALSNNYITIVRQMPEGGEVSLVDGTTEILVTVGDGIPDVISMTNTGALITPYTYVITDEDNVILGISAGPDLDFEPAGEGICRVWGLSYTGSITALIGDNAAEVALSDDCFDLSDNFVTVTRATEGFQEGGIQSFVAGSTSEMPQISLELWPNPAGERLNVRVATSGLEESAQWIEIINLNGVTLLRQPISIDGVGGTYELNLDRLDSGMYLLRWSNDKETRVQRFIKQ